MRLPCWLVGHAPLLTRRFDPPPRIVWICRFCLKDLGATVLNVTILPFRSADPREEKSCSR